MKIHEIELSGKHYHLAEQTADQQLELFEQLGARVLANFVNSEMEDIDQDFIFGVLLSSKQVQGPSIQELGKIVLYKCFEKGSNNLVGLDQFQGCISDYTRLVAEGVRANLADFFTSIKAQATKERQLREQQKQIETALVTPTRKKKKA